METLSLLGIHTDGEHLVLVNTEGERFLLSITEELRSTVRQQQRRLAETLTNMSSETLRPKDIQTLIRSGLTSSEVASASGLDPQHISLYEAPVLAERSWTAAQARDTQVSLEKDSPSLGDLVVDRLATRGVSPESLNWDATRQPGEHWVVHLEFVQDAKSMEASWDFDLENRILTALDEQSRWLTETTTPAGSPSLGQHNSFFRSPLTADFATSATKDFDAEKNVSYERSSTENLLDELNAARGTRLQVVTEDEDDDVTAMEAAVAKGFKDETSLNTEANLLAPESEDSSHTDPDELPPAPILPLKNTKKLADNSEPNPKTSQQVNRVGILPGMEEVETGVPDRTKTSGSSEPRQTRSRGRAQMPSWDEILFGAKGE